jgi:vacuolar-type H+-ATPase subunit I/STV1
VSSATETMTIRPDELKVFPREVSGVVMELVNQHGVRYRAIDGSHILLYSEDKTQRPFKISAKRPSQQTMLYMARWIVTNVPDFYGESVVEDIKASVAEVEEDDQPKTLVYTTGRVSTCLVVDPATGVVSCTTCGYQQESARGAHLHEAKHTGQSVTNALAGNDARRARAAERREKLEAEQEKAREAVHFLANYHGVIDSEGVEQLHAELAERVAEVEQLKQERNDLKAKLAMIKEAMAL